MMPDGRDHEMGKKPSQRKEGRRVGDDDEATKQSTAVLLGGGGRGE